MTYAATQVSYWVIQANDLSTGIHPTGWVSGQRWSVTAAQWQGMYNTEYANARDTSTGAHPNGWGNGQFWSTTAAQWMQMYNDEVVLYNNMVTDRNNWMNAANYYWGPSRVYNNGSTWEQLYNNEVNLYNDMVNQKNYWVGQANYYWGPSRAWNNGRTWEDLYNEAYNNYVAYVNYYNDMVNQRDTWAARANSAWGPSRSWSSGESWEAAYNRVLPPNGAVHLQAIGYVNPGGDGWRGNVVSLNVDRAGYWLITSHATRHDVACGSRVWGGSTWNGYFWGLDRSGDTTNGGPAAGDYWYGFMSAGQNVYAGGAGDSHGGSSPVWLDAWFIPTQQYPH